MSAAQVRDEQTTRERFAVEEMNMDRDVVSLVEHALAIGSSDLLLCCAALPTVRRGGALQAIDTTPITSTSSERWARTMTPQQHWRAFERDGQVEFSLQFGNIARLRVSLFQQRGMPSLAIRLIPPCAPTLEKLGVPRQVLRLVAGGGLSLVTGPTGSGKSTTLAGIVDWMNRHSARHIIMLEDPIEYVHAQGNCLIEQREVGTDTSSFEVGLKSALRQSPDVIVVGELRDATSIAVALTAAETGHLVLSTLHSGTAVDAVERIAEAFAAVHQPLVRAQLAGSLRGIVAQRLFPRPFAQETAQVLACEMLWNTVAVANLIRTGATHQLLTIMQTSGALGMRTMAHAAAELGIDLAQSSDGGVGNLLTDSEWPTVTSGRKEG